MSADRPADGFLDEKASGIRLSLPAKLFVVGVLLAGFPLFAHAFGDVLGGQVNLVGVIPLLLAGWWFGFRAGVSVAVLVLLIRMALIPRFPDVVEIDFHWTRRLIEGVILVLIGGTIGWTRSLRDRLWQALDRQRLVDVELRRSEERFRTLMENSLDGILISGENGQTLLANSAAARILDIPKDRLLSASLLELDVDDPQALEGYRRNLEEGRGRDILPFRDASGARRLAEYTVSRLASNSGLCILRDVTERERISEELERRIEERTGELAAANLALREEIAERERVEEEARQNEFRLRRIADALPGALYQYRLDPDGSQSFPYLSERASEAFGATVDAIRADVANAWRIVHPDDVARVAESIRISAERLEPWRETYRVSASDDDVRWIQGTANPEKLEDGAILWNGFLLDVTDVKRTEEALRRSEDLYRAASERGLDAFFLLADVLEEDQVVDFRFVDVNSRAEQWLGRSKDTLVGRRLSDALPFYCSLGMFEKFLAAAESHEAFEEEFRLVDAGVRGEWFRQQVVPIEEGLAVTTRDVTERRRSERELRESEDRLRRMVENLPAGAVYVQRNQIVVNREVETITGYSRERLSTIEEWFSTLFPGRAAEARSEYEDGFSSGIGRRREITIRRSDGADRVIEFNAYADAKGEFWLLYDVTERHRAERERRQLERQMLHAQKLESLGVLAGGIAHDFNNLLVGILGNAGLVLPELSKDDPHWERLKDIEVAAQRAADLCRQMLAYSGKGQFEIEPVDLSELVREMGHLLEISISKKATLRFELECDLPAVEADATQLRQIVMNLISNASEAFTDTEGKITVRTGLRHCDRAFLDTAYLDDDLSEGEYVFVSVADNGCGMDEATVKRIFDPFFTTKFTGRGLGLAAVIGIVRGHRGALRVESAPGKGSNFQVLFPVSRKPVSQKAAETELAPPRLTPNGAVLVVDDEEVVRKIATAALRRAGFETMTAGDGEEAIRVFQEHGDRISLVLLDMTMPTLNGAETFDLLRKIDPDVRVIIMTGYSEKDAGARFTDKELTAFLQKPYRPRDLVKQVRKVLDVGYD